MAIILSALFLGVGTVLSWRAPADALALVPLLLAILTAGQFNKKAALLVMGLASLAWLTPPLLTGHLPGLIHFASAGCLWGAGALLFWETNQAELNIHAFNKALLDSPIGLMVADMQGNIITCNDTMAQMCDRAVATLCEGTLAGLAGTDFWTLLTEQHETLMNDDALAIEFDLGANGDQRFLAGHAKLAKDDRGAARYYIVQVEDLTEKLSAKQALHGATQQIRRILSNSSDMVFITNHKLVIAFANQAATNTLGVQSANIVGTSIYKAIERKQHLEFTEAIGAFADQGRKEVTLQRIHVAGEDTFPVMCQIIRLSAHEADSGAGSYAVICRLLGAQDEGLVNNRSNDRFSQVFHSSPDAIMIMRAQDQVILDFNDGFSRLLGYSREDAIGESGIESTFWDNVVERDAVVAKLASEREVIDYETTLRTKTGQVVHVEISLRYIEIDGELCILCIGRDITQRISAEAALIETEEKFEKVFTQSPDGIVIIRQRDGVITDFNEAFQLRSGYERAELLDRNFLDYFPVFHHEELSSINAELVSEGVFNNRGVTFQTKSAETVACLISATLLELGGEAFAMIIAKDISKQRATEERLRRSEERFRGIFENAPIGILLVDMQGRIFQANHTAASLLSYEQQQMYGVHISRLVPNDGRPALRDSLSQLAVSKSSISKAERRLVRQDGLELWSNFQIVLQRSSKHEPLYYIVQIADISDVKQSQERMEQMAFYDTLTQLANRRLFQDRLNRTIERCDRHNRSAALLYLDLDNFKRVNDTLGHQTGDHLLQEVASRLKRCVRRDDTVGRSGGDEFTILLNEIVSPADAGQVAQKILNNLREPIEISGHPLVVTTSIGITIIPSDGADPTTLMRNADLAMYQAKERGRNNFQFYSEDLNVDAVKRLKTEYQIRAALDSEEFELYFQPKISLSSGQIVGVESLIRWHHPERGLVGPDEFVGIAEETGSIIDIGSWVIEASCKAARQLSSAHALPITVAVNISSRQFKDPNLVTTVRRCLREQSLAPGMLEIEITETMLMQDVDAAQATVLKLSELGVRLAIDDFGTGYSSLNYLKRFPINTVKVDRSFVMDVPKNPDDMAITRAVIAMAHQLNMEVVAEGVETDAQRQFLTDEKCEYAQGYLFSKPLPLDDINALITSQRDPTAASQSA